MTSDREQRFDPRAILAALQAESVAHVVIGGLARVLRGSDEVTHGVDVCPLVQGANLERLNRALVSVGAVDASGAEAAVSEEHLRAEATVVLETPFGELKLMAEPAGVPRGFDALRVGATGEHLGNGLRPEIASTGDLIVMSAALRREQDRERVPTLRRILELEADPASLVAVSPPLSLPRALSPGAALKLPVPAKRPGTATTDRGPGR